MSERLYYYCFSFTGRVPDGRSADASSYAGYAEKPNFTVKEINKRKILSVLEKDAVLISITFLGVMSVSEFNG